MRLACHRKCFGNCDPRVVKKWEDVKCQRPQGIKNLVRDKKELMTVLRGWRSELGVLRGSETGSHSSVL